MCRGGRRPGTGVKKGEKRGVHEESCHEEEVGAERCEHRNAHSVVASGNTDEAPQDELDDGAHVLEVDDKSTVRANVGRSENWQLASVGTTRQIDHDFNMGGGEGA